MSSTQNTEPTFEVINKIDNAGGASPSNVDLNADQSLHDDAYRYRWLRENISADLEWLLLGKHGLGPNGVDAAIDHARKASNA